MANYYEEIKKIVAEKLSIDEKQVTPESSFIDDLGADSLDIVEMLMEIEEHFELDIPDSESEKLRTVQAAVDYITAKKGEA